MIRHKLVKFMPLEAAIWAIVTVVIAAFVGFEWALIPAVFAGITIGGYIAIRRKI